MIEDHRPDPRALREALADLATDDGDHLTSEQLAVWVEGGAGDGERQAIEAHLASCTECRGLVRDVAASLESIAPSPVPIDSPRRRVDRRVGRRRWLAVAATVLLAVAGWQWLRLDPRLDELGVDVIAAMVGDRHLAGEASRWLDGDPSVAPTLDFGSFAPQTIPSRSAVQAPVPLTPRFEAVGGAAVEWWWHGALAATEILVVDSHDELILRHRIDPAAIRRHATANAYGPIPDLPALDPDTIYAWKLNAETPTGEIAASDFVPFRVLANDAEPVADGGRPSLLAATAAWRVGAHGVALRHLAALPGSETERATLMRSVLEHQRLPESVVVAELERRLAR